MPMYEYECTKCGNHSEMLQRFSDAPITECSECHGKMKKLISQSTFHLKGTGWYVTDYANKSKSNQAPKTSSTQESGSDGKKNKSEKAGSKTSKTEKSTKVESKG